jgi:hypothetical protein
VLDTNPGHRNAQQQRVGRVNGIADEVADKQQQRGGGQVELRAPPPLVVVLVVVPLITAAVIVLLSCISRFAGDSGGGGGVVVPKGVAIPGIAAGRSAGAMIIVVTIDTSGRWEGGDGATPDEQRHRGTVAPAAATAGRPPPWLGPGNL